MGDFLIKMINLLIKGLGSVLSVIFSILPPSPFKALNNSPISEYLGGLNYFIPVDEIISISEIWLVAIATFYIQQVILRWIKAVE